MHENEVSLRDLIGILRRQSRLIWASLILFFGAALIYAITAQPLYRAETLILVNPIEQNVLNPTQQAALGNSLLNARVESEVEILESPTIALAVVRDAGLIADPEFGPSLSTTDKIREAVGLGGGEEPSGEEILQGVVDRFMKARSVSRRGLTFVISVAVETGDPVRSAELSNALAQSYIAHQVDSKVANSLAARDVLQGQIIVAQQKLAASEEELNRFISQNLERLESEAQSDALSALRGKLEGFQAERQKGSMVGTLASRALESQDWQALATQLQDDALTRLAEERLAFESRLRNAELDSELETELRKALGELETSLDARASAGIEELQVRVAGLDAQISQTQEEIRSALFRSDVSSQTLAEVFALQQSAELSRQQVQALLGRLTDLEAQAAVQVADSRIVSEAMPPQGASFPNLKLILAMSVVLGLAVGGGLAFTGEYYVGGVASASQLSNVVGTPVAGEFPLQDEEKGQLSVADNIVNKPVSAYAESLRHVVATISQRMHAKGRDDLADPGQGKADARATVVLVTSSVPSEGKTTSALSLARTYAESGQRTLLIDADLRKPSVAEQLGKSTKAGLAKHLRKNKEANLTPAFISDDPMTDLDVVLGGQHSTMPTDHLLASTQFGRILERLRSQYDIIIIDSPPVVPVVDARYVVPLADVILLVARYHSTSQGDIRHSMSLIRGAAQPDAEIFAILNQKDMGHENRGYYSYYQT